MESKWIQVRKPYLSEVFPQFSRWPYWHIISIFKCVHCVTKGSGALSGIVKGAVCMCVRAFAFVCVPPTNSFNVTLKFHPCCLYCNFSHISMMWKENVKFQNFASTTSLFVARWCTMVNAYEWWSPFSGLNWSSPRTFRGMTFPNRGRSQFSKFSRLKTRNHPTPPGIQTGFWLYRAMPALDLTHFLFKVW